MEITINQNDNQLISISNNNLESIGIEQNDNQLITINNNNSQDIDINQNENQTILIDGGGVAIGISDVLVNGVSVVSSNIAYIIVPTKTSQLINNSGFITSETDPTVPSYIKSISLADINSWNNKQDLLVSGTNIKTINSTSLLGSGNINISGSSEYSAGSGIDITNNVISNTITSYNDLSDTPTIPTLTSQLTNDSDYVTSEDLSEVAFTGSYASLSNTPENLSEFINDAGYIDNTVDDLVNYTDTTTLNTELSSKQDTLVSGTNIKTINNTSLLGSGNIAITQPTKTSDLTNDGNGTYPFMLNKSSNYIDGIGLYGGSSAYARNLSYVWDNGIIQETKLIANYDDLPTPHILYNGDTNTNIILNDDIENYNTIKVYYYRYAGGGKTYSSKEFETPSNKILVMDMVIIDANYVYLFASRYLGTNTNFNYVNGGWQQNNISNNVIDSYGSNSQIYITKIIGYK